MIAELVACFSVVGPPQGPAAGVIDAPVTDRAPVIDGRLGLQEWTGAARLELETGLVLLTLRHEDTLYLAFRREGGGIGTVALFFGSEVHVLHSSQQLGRAVYRGGDRFTLEQNFSWSPVDASSPLDESGQPKDVQAYFKAHGWVASTIPYAREGAMEWAIALDYAQRLTPQPADAPAEPVTRVAVGFFALRGGSVCLAPKSVRGSMSDPSLHMGSPPKDAAFEPETWFGWPKPTAQDAEAKSP